MILCKTLYHCITNRIYFTYDALHYSALENIKLGMMGFMNVLSKLNLYIEDPNSDFTPHTTTTTHHHHHTPPPHTITHHHHHTPPLPHITTTTHHHHHHAPPPPHTTTTTTHHHHYTPPPPHTTTTTLPPILLAHSKDLHICDSMTYVVLVGSKFESPRAAPSGYIVHSDVAQINVTATMSCWRLLLTIEMCTIQYYTL